MGSVSLFDDGELIAFPVMAVFSFVIGALFLRRPNIARKMHPSFLPPLTPERSKRYGHGWLALAALFVGLTILRILKGP